MTCLVQRLISASLMLWHRQRSSFGDWLKQRPGWNPRVTRDGRRWLAIGLSLLTLLLTLQSSPGWTQTSFSDGTVKAPVIVDGRTVFDVGTSGSFTAQGRANQLSIKLNGLLQSQETVDLRIVGSTPPVLICNKTNCKETSDRNLLVTLTEGDVPPDTMDAVVQAYRWKRRIETAIQQGRWERTAAYRRQAFLIAAGVLVGAILIHLVLRLLGQWAALYLRRWLGRPASPLHAWEQPAKLLLQLGLLGLQVGLWAAVLFYISDLFPESRIWRYQLRQFLTSPILPVGDTTYSASQLLLLLASAVGLWFAVSALTRFLRSYVLGQTGADPALQEVVTVLTQYTLTFLGLIVLLQIWKFDVSSLTLLAGILGVGIGFGVQNIANNFISGLIITIERPIQVGDFVDVGNLTGIVERIGARSTQIRTMDRVTIIVPNSRFLESEVINWSHGDSISRLRISVGVAYGSDVNQVQTALLEAAKSHPDVLVSPRPQVWFQEFGESSLKFDLLVWTGDPKQQPRIKSDLNYRIEACLRRYGIEVPFPQRDLNIRSPKLEAFLDLWLQKQAPQQSNSRDFSNPNGFNQQNASLAVTCESTHPESTPTELPPTAAIPVTELQLPLPELEALAQRMREPGGVEIKNRHYRLSLYPDCFVGSEAVDWLMETRQCSRPEAVAIGQALMEHKLIHHVVDRQPFRDGYFFYRFYADEV